ncbi:MAG TPA: hypothetical protein VK097_07280 [Lentibacillus sp.]|uniref:hypothetical protein n=1 Tax=Lentibacillus sp. TaxID=1925746 RepID=UPI002B4AD241|nr:hypothetical protein [Lentibacillus sp.]HLR62226.1 hypothetical protein [Lentibacillus sp.]
MMKTVKGQFILSTITAILFVTGSFFYIEFAGEERFLFTRILFYFAMVISVYNAGLLTQKYIQIKQK